MNGVKKCAALLITSYGAFETSIVHPSSGRECLTNDVCNPGAIVLADTVDPDLVEPPIVNVNIAAGSPGGGIQLALEPGWSFTDGDVSERKRILASQNVLPVKIPLAFIRSLLPV